MYRAEQGQARVAFAPIRHVDIVCTIIIIIIIIIAIILIIVIITIITS